MPFYLHKKLPISHVLSATISTTTYSPCLFERVCLCKCCYCVYMHTCTYRGLGSTSGVSLWSETHWLGQSDWPANPRVTTCVSLPGTVITSLCVTTPNFWDFNPCPHVHWANTLPIEPSPKAPSSLIMSLDCIFLFHARLVQCIKPRAICFQDKK